MRCCEHPYKCEDKDLNKNENIYKNNEDNYIENNNILLSTINTKHCYHYPKTINKKSLSGQFYVRNISHPKPTIPLVIDHPRVVAATPPLYFNTYRDRDMHTHTHTHTNNKKINLKDRHTHREREKDKDNYIHTHTHTHT
eukprot:GHVR01042859.1.p1 GENE.GHVR01042859.1~~GHVR01042859.1.p1  ORF type:complete len:140 (+),score=67.76 GHVR01042859.1:132-551(+)